MKEFSNVKRGLSFGFSALNAGQRQVVYEPQVIATSTDGGFRITPIISKLLGVESGDNILFITNVDNIDAAIQNDNAEVVAFCEENGLAPKSPEAIIAVHKAFDLWAIAKGVQEYDAKGNPKTSTERLTKKDKMLYVSNNFEAIMEQAMASDNEELKASLNIEGITTEEQVSILAELVKGRELPKFKGSKCANPAGLTGTNVTLTFTDSNVWAQLKADLGENATKFNRVFNVDVNNIMDVEINNGYENVSVKALILGDYTDVRPQRIGSKDSTKEVEE